MPIYELICNGCGKCGEVLATPGQTTLACPWCGSSDTRKVMSPTSSITGKTRKGLPGPGDTACCGGSPSTAGCAGPGSCCGKGM